MVGRLALAAASLPDKDGDVQPCKKRREEDASVKTITRYFSPLAKTGDKVLSPPKPNNILDYFKKSSVPEKATVPAVVGESKAQFDGNDKDCKSHHKPPSKLKRKRKRVNLNNKLREMKEPENEGTIEINCDDSRETTEPKQDSNDFIATCTSADQNRVGESPDDNTQGENFSDADIYGKSVKKVGSEVNAVKNRIRKSRKRKHKVCAGLSDSLSFENQLNEECKKETKDNKMVSPEVVGCDAITISDSSFDTHTNEALQVNSSTITVSFEDFLRSQGEHNVDHAEEGTKPMLDDSVTATELDRSGSTSDPEKSEESQQVPLRTVTVLAQVHSIPPRLASLHREQKGSMKIASIFLKQKGCIGEKESSPPLLESEQTEHIAQKRKSNVVIEEEELELAVLETAGSDPLKTKSALEERHQFMKAFRQPTSDVIKSGVKKAPGKPKQVTGKSSKDKKGSEGDIGSNKGLGSGVPEDCVDKHTHSCPENHRTKTKRPKKFQKRGNRRRKALEAKEKCVLNTSDYNEEKESGADLQTKENNLDVIILSSPKENKLRRSLRQKQVDISKTVTPKKNRIRNTFSEDESVCPLQTSTPKTSKQSLKRNMYKAEVITVPSDANSPIRMRFTRINATLKSNKGEAMKNEELNSNNTKISSTSKNVSKAKQLVEKAKAIRHNRSKVNEDLPTPVRRSSRQQALAEKKQLQENEKSAITVHSSLSNATTTVQNVKQKNLRSLNDVLGKKSRNMKASKNSNGKLGYPSFLGKNAQKSADEPIVIFDESSQDASENSQDDDQFRSKREFLMSGLPELLKRQIAKKAAATEAYSLASSCFKTVVHVQQKDDRHPMWKLKSPLCPLLTKLRKLSPEVTNITKITISLGEFSTVKSELTGNCSAPVFSGRRSVFPDAVRKGLLDEILSSNSQFPVRKYLYAFLRRQTERLLFENSTQESRDGAANSEVNKKHSDNWKETKRKRKETEDHKSKRRKQVDGTESELKSRVSRNLAAPVSGGKQADAAQATHLRKNKNQKPDVMTEDNEYLSEPNALSGVEKEDMLWTEKYQPQDSSELVGNRKEIERLHSWLKEWKKRADWEEKRNQKGEKEDKEHQDSLDSLDFKGSESDIEEEINLCNTVLITGPPGVGKTAAVYACAQELGFKIFEVNASCQRSGRQVLSQLREATQSHQVDKKGINAHKPCFFNSCSSAKSPKKMYSPKKVISPRKPPLSPKGAGLKRNLPPKTLANYFKMPSKYKGNDGTVTSQEKNKVLHRSAVNVQSSSEEKDAQMKSINKEVEGGEHNRKSATSLILFEEVDIIFDEDAGFLSAIKTFMATAKRPVILTTNDPTFSLMFDGYFEEINFRTPSLMNAASYLQALCLAENLRTDVKDLAALLTTNNCDIRQSVLFLQFWVKSGGGYLKDKCLALHGEDETNKTDQVTNSEKAMDSKIEVSQAEAPLQEFPKCDTGCVETLLGLRNILLPSEDLFTFLKKITTMEKWDKLIQLLTEFQLKTVDFMYSNLELLLPLPVHYISNQSEASNSTLERTTIVSSKNKSINSYCSGKKSKKTKNKKRLDVLDDSDLFDTALNYSAEFLSLPSDSPTPCAEVNSEEAKLMNSEGKDVKSKTPANDKRSALVCQCLNSLTEFVENMSFLDCCVNSNTREPLEFSQDGFNWTNGKIKNGLCDEFRIENTDWWSSQSCSEIKAAIEALSFNKCSVSISQKLETSLSSNKTPESDQLEGLTMHISNTRNYVSFNQSADSSIHEKAQKRLAVIRTIFSRAPLNLGNKQASILEYLPTLRSICRSEKIKEQGKTKRRFLHYLEGIHLEIPRQMIHSLSLDFP
ncbi:ATPase family AAA domain-containing protein 5 isoform X2 [Oxyura jamaicensis]|uniref:ATPase family AAA domain-containing protein 5 isoform X2 n=1 Tax=Oxyura jamaicensis TaxID=8884 RepID=UPI0015A4F43A|nr:ATPase family AAA domain-containing protein 5 isoform X2 [Oxyura jamaicensis]